MITPFGHALSIVIILLILVWVGLLAGTIVSGIYGYWNITLVLTVVWASLFVLLMFPPSYFGRDGLEEHPPELRERRREWIRSIRRR